MSRYAGGRAGRQFRQALQIAAEVMTGDLADPTGGADHHHRDDVSSAWAVGRKPIRTIGRHVVYRLGRAGQQPCVITSPFKDKAELNYTSTLIAS